MKTMMSASLMLSLSISAAWAQGPKISSPDETLGVFERMLDVGLMQSARPLPKPDRLAAKEEAAPESPELTGITLTADQMPFSAYIEAGRQYRLGQVSDAPAFGFAAAPAASESPFRYVLNTKTSDSLPMNESEEIITVAVDPMTAIIQSTLAGSYGIKDMQAVVDGDSGYDRLLNLAEGMSYNRAPAVVSADAYVSQPVDQSGNSFAASIMPTSVAPQMAPGFQGTVMGMDPAAAILNSLSKEHLVNMSPDQITALVMAAQGRPFDIAAMRAANQQMSTPQMAGGYAAPLNGIPSLDYRGDDLPTPQVISASDVPSGSSPFSANSFVQAAPTQAPAPMHVGDGQNLLLKGWTLGLTGSGSIGMYMAGDPGSIIEITEGMVVGPLGAVRSLRMENGNIIAEFSSGEVMTSPAALVSMASL